MAFLVVLACATTMTVPVVGALLIFTLMIGPPAAARCFSDRPGFAMVCSVAIALLTVWAALASSVRDELAGRILRRRLQRRLVRSGAAVRLVASIPPHAGGRADGVGPSVSAILIALGLPRVRGSRTIEAGGAGRTNERGTRGRSLGGDR